MLYELLKSLFGSEEETPESIKGEMGEEWIAAKLKHVNFWGLKGMMLRNLYLPKGEKDMTEIDLLYITQKGIFVIESKNYAGYIFGNENYSEWTVSLYKGKDWLGRKQTEKYHFYNPIWQNRTHMKTLYRFVSKDVPMYSLIVFSERCRLMDITYDSEDTYVCQVNDLPRTMRYMKAYFPDVLTKEQVEDIYQGLLPFTRVTQQEKSKHIQQVQEIEQEALSRCPWCGGMLVLRTAKQGVNAGRQFYGCANYPKCRYTRNL